MKENTLEDFAGIFLFFLNVILTVYSQGNLSGMQQILCSQKVNKPIASFDINS